MPDLVCDTSVLVALHRVGLLDILQSLSTADRAERGQPGTNEWPFPRLRRPDIARLNWITVRSPSHRPALPNAPDLGPGESEVLWLAQETLGSIAVLDDAAARGVASHLGVAFTGTLGLLVDAKRRGLVPAVAPLLDELKHHNFHMSARIRETILQAAGESPEGARFGTPA